MYQYSQFAYQSEPYEVDINISSNYGVKDHCSTYIEGHPQQYVHVSTQNYNQRIRTHVQQAVQDQMDQFLKDKDRLSKLFESIKEKKDNFQRIILKAKTDCLEMVSHHFEELQKKWQQDIIMQERKHSLHSQQNLSSLDQLLRSEINCLIDLRRVLNNFDYVDHIKRIEEQTLIKCKNFHQRVVNQIEDNEQYSPIIHYNVDVLDDISRNLKNLLSLEFKMPVGRQMYTKEKQIIKQKIHKHNYLQRNHSSPNLTQTINSGSNYSANFYSTVKTDHGFLDNYDQIIKSRCSQALRRPASVSKTHNVTVITKKPVNYSAHRVLATSYQQVPKPKPKVVVTSYYKDEPRRYQAYNNQSKIILTKYEDVPRKILSTSYISPPSTYYKEAVINQPVIIEKLSPEYFKQRTNVDSIIFEKPNSYKLQFTTNYTGSINLAKYSKNELNKENMKFKKCGYSSLNSTYGQKDGFVLHRDNRWK